MAWCLCGYDAGGGVRFPAASGGRPEGARKLTSMISFNNLALSSSICCSTCVSCGTSGCPFCFCGGFGGFGGCGGAGSMALAPCPRYRRCSCSPRASSLVLFFFLPPPARLRCVDLGCGQRGRRKDAAVMMMRRGGRKENVLLLKATRRGGCRRRTGLHRVPLLI